MNDKVSDIPVKSKKRFYILMAASIVGAVLLKWSFIFFAIGMLPAIVAYLVDHDKHKYVFYTVAALNLSGVFPEMVGISMQGGSLTAVIDRLSDIMVWFTMYSAAALGWGIVWLSPVVTAMVLEGVYHGRISHMESIQKKLEEEWGAEINRRAGGE